MARPKREDKRGKSYYIGGVKLFMILNEQNQILDADITHINQADITQLRKTAYKFKGTIVLADRGFKSTTSTISHNI